MSITEESTQKLKILSQRALQPIEKIESEFKEALRLLSSDVRLKLDERGLQKKAYTVVLSKYQSILTAKKFVGFIYSKDRYFDQTTWLTTIAKSVVEKQGEPNALNAKWLNAKKEYCDGRPHLDNLKTIKNPQHGNVIRSNQGNRTVRILAHATNEKTGVPFGSLIDMRLTLNGKYGVDSALSQNNYPMNEWISFYATINPKQKEGLLEKRVKFPPNNVIEAIGDDLITQYKLEDVYTTLVKFYASAPPRKQFLLGVENVDKQGMINLSDKKMKNEVFLIQSEILQVPPAASFFGSVILDGGKELSLDGDVDLSNLTVKLPPYIIELIKYGVGSTVLTLGTIYKANKKDKDNKPIKDEFEASVFQATNLIPVPGQFVTVQTEAITEDKVKNMASGAASVELESVTPDTDLSEGGGF